MEVRQGLLTSSNHSLPLFPKSDTPSDANTLWHESLAREAGYDLLAGVDEAGRGPLAGPVVAAAVIMPEGVVLPGIKDSKLMTEKARDASFAVIAGRAVAVGVGVVSQAYIDTFNILKGSLEAMKLAVSYLDPAPEYLLVDGIHSVPVALPQKCLKKGDRKSHSISAASVVAKVYRDRIMRCYHHMYPSYGFRANKGYGTAQHLTALREHGPSPVHRVTFKRVCAGPSGAEGV